MSGHSGSDGIAHYILMPLISTNSSSIVLLKHSWMTFNGGISTAMKNSVCSSHINSSDERDTNTKISSMKIKIADTLRKLLILFPV